MKRIVALIAIVFFIIISNVRLFSLQDDLMSAHVFNLKGYEILDVEHDLTADTRLVPQSALRSEGETHQVRFTHTVRQNDASMNPIITVTLETRDGMINDELQLINHTTTLLESNDDVYVYETILTLNRPSDSKERALFRSIQSFTINLSLTS